MRLGGAGVDFQRFAKLGDRLVKPALRGQRDPEVVVHVDGTRHHLERTLKMIDGLLRSAQIDEDIPDVVVRLGIIRL